MQAFKEAVDEAEKKEKLTFKDAQQIRVEFDKLKTAPETAKLAKKIEPHIGTLERLIREKKGDRHAVFETIKKIKITLTNHEEEIRHREQNIFGTIESGYRQFSLDGLTAQHKDLYKKYATQIEKDQEISKTVKAEYAKFMEIITADEKPIEFTNKKTATFIPAFLKEFNEQNITAGDIVGKAIKTSFSSWMKEVEGAYDEKGYWSSFYRVISTPGLWVLNFGNEAITKPVELVKSITPIGTAQMVKGAFKRAYENPNAENMAYLRLSMYVFAFDSIATYAAFRPLKPLVIRAKTALTDALRKGLTKESLEVLKDGVIQLSRTAQTILADQTGGMLSRETYQKFIDAPRRLIMGLPLDEQTKKVILDNILDKTWISDRSVQLMFKDRLRDMEVWRSSFSKVAGELGWDEATKAKYSEALLSLVDVSERAPYSKYGHNLRVFQYTEQVLDHLDLPAREKAKIKMAALIHDVGKIGVDNKHLRKAGKLSEEEFMSIKSHAHQSPDILEKVRGKFQGVSEKDINDIGNIAKYHHENFDGSGYFGINGESIPIGARILRIADSFDTLASERIYRPPQTVDYILNDFREKGKWYDQKLTDIFSNALSENQITFQKILRSGK